MNKNIFSVFSIGISLLYSSFSQAAYIDDFLKENSHKGYKLQISRTEYKPGYPNKVYYTRLIRTEKSDLAQDLQSSEYEWKNGVKLLNWSAFGVVSLKDSLLDIANASEFERRFSNIPGIFGLSLTEYKNFSLFMESLARGNVDFWMSISCIESKIHVQIESKRDFQVHLAGNSFADTVSLLLDSNWSFENHRTFSKTKRERITTALALAAIDPTSSFPKHPQSGLYRMPLELLNKVFEYMGARAE